ncbi:MAG: FAD-dependent monooxygenase [Microbacterium sp.]
MDTQVLIVGAGPTGLTLAGELSRRGVDCRLIDSLDAPLSWDRATIVHPRTMELFATLGLSDEFVGTGVHQRYIYIYSDGERLAEMDLAESGSPFGFNLNVSEEVTERVLAAHLRAQGGSVEHGHRLVGLRQLPDRVIATIEQGDSEYELSAEWIVGCGGLHSPVRELSGIAFEGHDIPEPWAVLDATLAGWPHGHDANFAFLDRDSVILTPLPGDRWRAYIRPTSAGSDLVEDATRVIERYAPGMSLTDVANPTRFHCHTKVAARYRKGRALLAGDAAHVCSPSQGHGMNTGIQDSFNLAWKLALVCQGGADPQLLDSYQTERRPVALMVTASGDDFETMQTLIADEDRADRDAAIRATFADRGSRHQEILGETELNISYEDSPIVAGTSAGLGAGQRLPAEICLQYLTGGGTGHALLVIGREVDLVSDVRESIEGAHADAFDEVIALGTEHHPALTGVLHGAVADRIGVGHVAVLAVRPDGYIGHRSDGADIGPVGEYLELIRSGGGSRRRA